MLCFSIFYIFAIFLYFNDFVIYPVFTHNSYKKHFFCQNVVSKKKKIIWIPENIKTITSVIHTVNFVFNKIILTSCYKKLIYSLTKLIMLHHVGFFIFLYGPNNFLKALKEMKINSWYSDNKVTKLNNTWWIIIIHIDNEHMNIIMIL